MSVPSQYAVNIKNTGAPRVRRRRLALFVVLLAGVLFFLFSPWEIPGISRANMGQLIKSKTLPVEEIYGLLHLVTGDHEQEHVLNKVDLDPTTPLAMDIYAAGDSTLDWHKEMVHVNEEYPIVVFSKTYCPYSKRAKQLLEGYDLQPPPKVIEVDLRDDGIMIKHLLSRITGHSTFPNILLRGESIGGSDHLQRLHAEKTLKKLLEKNGVSSRSNGPSQ
ncbi:hypothetical protein HYPSUDRAFT_35020 [Hypholoma sublateritium FD-334 SS-4]|uniref:Glutaredoxin domain-containing protein n=1 Tax=Hypholoma sublateritium (strain FD-334 SS-4) TaxID=945553 RepID=A0A0D2PH66_HYPSF|nr:hypothetical protein HYPSUDRAFT_35020 [Hypholoma sublateritium FD-334 SS-4]